MGACHAVPVRGCDGYQAALERCEVGGEGVRQDVLQRRALEGRGPVYASASAVEDGGVSASRVFPVEILDLADFVALGTNDLTQYMLATDRDLAKGEDECTALHPAVLRAIKQVVEAAEDHHSAWRLPVSRQSQPCVHAATSG